MAELRSRPMAAAIATRSATMRRAPFRRALGHFDSSIAAWARRLQSGPAGLQHGQHHGAPMLTPDGGHLAALADWTDRIKAGELPSATPPRPTGIERNLVVTVRDWSDPKHYLHDLTLTDKRKPTVNGYGLIYGAAELSTDNLPILDPVHNTKTVMKVPVRDPKNTPSSALGQSGAGAVALLGHRADLGHPGQRPQSDDGPGRQGLFHRAAALAQGPAGLLQAAIRRCARPSSIRSPERPTVSCRMRARSPSMIPRPRSSRSSTPASAPIISILPRTPTTRCG